VGKWGPILGTGRLLTPELFREQIAPASAHLGNNKPDAYFAFGFVVSNGWIVQNPAINGYSAAFGYSMPHGVTITLAATKSETSTTDFAAFEILGEVVKSVTPDCRSLSSATAESSFALFRSFRHRMARLMPSWLDLRQSHYITPIP
jgi:hypothetical protein